MLFTIFLLFIGSCYAAPQESGTHHVYHAEDSCFEKHPSVGRDFIEELKKLKELPENPTTDFKCFLACVGKRIEAMTHTGDLVFDTLKSVTVSVTAGDVTHDNAHSMVQKCLDVADHADDCEKAYQYVKCKIEELKPFKFAKEFCPSCHT